jgi:galactose-1-phosphate uridylyltransferase
LRSLHYALPSIQYSQYIWWREFIILLQLKNWNAHSLESETFKDLLVAFALFPQTFRCGFGHINVKVKHLRIF